MLGALLLVTMQPSSAMEEEFNDWYDTEHVPERVNLPGFLSASRWVAVDGWPRYLALYELESLETLRSPEYMAVSGDHFSPWTRRVTSRTVGRARIVAEAVGPAMARLPPSRSLAQLLVARYPDFDSSFARMAHHCCEAGQGGLRMFCSESDLWLLAWSSRPVALRDLMRSFGEISGLAANFFNLYVPYFRNE